MKKELDRYFNILKRPSLKKEWRYIVNRSVYSKYPKFMWQYILHRRGKSKAQLDSFFDGFSDLAKRKEAGETVRLFLYNEEERKSDPSKRDVVLYVNIRHKGAPVALLVPGGAYRFVSVMNEGFPVAAAASARGYNSAVLVYRVAEYANSLRPVEDLKRALSVLCDCSDELGVDRNNIFLFGSSAAGHLCGYYCAAQSLPADRPIPRALVLSYPVVTFSQDTHKESRSYFLGRSATSEDIASYSVERLITSSFPPTYVWHCEKDESVPISNSELLADALKKSGVSFVFRRFANGAHGLGGAAGMPESVWLDEAFDFCDRHKV